MRRSEISDRLLLVTCPFRAFPGLGDLWAQEDLNFRPHPYQGCALTGLSYGPPRIGHVTSASEGSGSRSLLDSNRLSRTNRASCPVLTLPGMGLTKAPGERNSRPEQIVHGSVSVDRELTATPGAVLAAFANAAVRATWFRIPGEQSRDLDFQVGGGETVTATTDVSGRTEKIEYRSRYIEVVDAERIVFTYLSQVDGLPHAIALVTVELTDTGNVHEVHGPVFPVRVPGRGRRGNDEVPP